MSREAAKLAVAQAALELVRGGMVVGVGTGSTTSHFIDGLGELQDGVEAAVASSLTTAERLARNGIRVTDLGAVDRLPLYVDGADEVDPRRQLIKGGGGALTREKIVAAASDCFVCIVDESKMVERLGVFPLPVEVIPMALNPVARAIERLGGRPVERPDFVTDNGNAILDVHDLTISDAPRLETELNQISGIVTNGLFAHRPADVVLVGGDDGVRRIE
jgi:ribose 5-phosphate isomerase A